MKRRILSHFGRNRQWLSDIGQNAHFLMKNADFVITGEGRFDKTSLNGKGPFEVIRQSSQNDIPSLVLAGSVDNEVKRQVKGKFHKCDLLAFGRSDWTLEKNLLLARDQFTSSLQNYSFS